MNTTSISRMKPGRAIGLSMILLLAAPLMAQKFEFHDLGVAASGTCSAAYGINNKGQIIGASELTPGGYMHPTLIDGPNNFVDLGYLDGLYGNSAAYSINEAGLVVGSIGSWPRQAFLASRDTPIQGIMPVPSIAMVINNLGQIAGVAGWGGGWGWDCVFLKNPDGTTQTFGGILGQSTWFGVWGLNDAGQMVGSSGTRAWLKNPGEDFIDIGTIPGGTEAFAAAINSHGQIAGHSTIAGSSVKHIFLLNPGEPMRDLGCFGGNAGINGCQGGLNDRGQIVGSSELVAPGGTPHGFFIDVDGVMQDLNDITRGIPDGMIIAYATGINNGEQVVGETRGTAQHAFLLVPVVPTPCELATRLTGTVTGLRLPWAIENSYLANLKKVCRFAETGKLIPAVEQVQAFITKVQNDLSKGRISTAVADNLIGQANGLIGRLQS